MNQHCYQILTTKGIVNTLPSSLKDLLIQKSPQTANPKKEENPKFMFKSLSLAHNLSQYDSSNKIAKDSQKFNSEIKSLGRYLSIQDFSKILLEEAKSTDTSLMKSLDSKKE